MSVAIAYTDDLTINCLSAYTSVILGHTRQLFSVYQILVNILYNVGFMTWDVLDIVLYNPSKVPNPYW